MLPHSHSAQRVVGVGDEQNARGMALSCRCCRCVVERPAHQPAQILPWLCACTGAIMALNLHTGTSHCTHCTRDCAHTSACKAGLPECYASQQSGLQHREEHLRGRSRWLAQGHARPAHPHCCICPRSHSHCRHFSGPLASCLPLQQVARRRLGGTHCAPGVTVGGGASYLCRGEKPCRASEDCCAILLCRIIVEN
jgi:hypothetical protein